MSKIHSIDKAIIELLEYFLPQCEDRLTMQEVKDMASDWRKWSDGHKLFDRIRTKTLLVERNIDQLIVCQYLFEEICAKTLYNLSNPRDPFDADSPFWILPIALQFAKAMGIEEPLKISSLLNEYL